MKEKLLNTDESENKRDELAWKFFDRVYADIGHNIDVAIQKSFCAADLFLKESSKK